MKKIYESSIFSKVLSTLLFVMAAVTSGGMSLAMAAASGQAMDPSAIDPPSGPSSSDPHAGSYNSSTGAPDLASNSLKGPAEGSIKDSPNKGIEQPGHASTGSALDEQGLVENTVDEYVKKYRRYRYPLVTDMWQKARQIEVDVKEPKDYEIGEAVSELNTIAAINGSGATEGEVTLTKGTHIAVADWGILRANVLVLTSVNGGYEGAVADGSPLVLYVTGKTKTEMTVVAVNGAPGTTNTEYKKVPTIPAGSKFTALAPAMSESEVEIEPDNAMPTERPCYLQKKVCSITYTELFNRIKKKAKWRLQDMRDYVLDKFKQDCTRNMLISKGSKFKKFNEKTGWEYAYTEEGILRQMRLGYELEDGQIDFSDLIAIQAMLCGKYNAPYELTAYCGTAFVQRLLNIDFSKHKEYTVRNYTDETTKIKITSFESNFGTLKFVHEYGLNSVGYGECAIIFGAEEAKHFYYQKQKTLKIDHEKGEGGEVREAKSEYYIKDDCVQVDTFNSMIVGPATMISGYSFSALDAVMKSVNELPSAANSAAVGDIVYLIADVLDSTTGAVTNAMGLYKCTAVNSTTNVPTWSAYDGKGIFVA